MSMANKNPKQPMTAAQTILLAAADLASAGANDGFTTAELVVAAWQRDKQRFGLPGFSSHHPSSHRVSMEIMGKKTNNPLVNGFMEKVRPNFYRLTQLGRVEAERLRGGSAGNDSATMTDIYERVDPFAAHAVFAAWQLDPAEPSRLRDAAAFLGEIRGPLRVMSLREKMRGVEGAVRAALQWCRNNQMDYLPRNTKRGAPTLHMRELCGLRDFLEVLRGRFGEQLGEINEGEVAA